MSGLGISVAPYARVDRLEDLRAALSRIKPPALLKTRRFGYDGKGQAPIRTEDAAPAALEAIGNVPALLEGLVLFEREISVIVVRGQDGALAFYDPVENVHQNGILAISRAPARIAHSTAVAAKEIAGKVADALSHVGVLCVEMFEREGESPALIVNEFAPRVHNSGHWTLDACLVSQFENHVRAICGWPLGETARHSDAVMTNLIGPMSKNGVPSPPSRIPPSISTARPRRVPGAKWATSPGCFQRAKPHLDNRGRFCYSNRGCGTLTGTRSGYIWPPAQLPKPTAKRRARRVQVIVRDNNVDQALGR